MAIRLHPDFKDFLKLLNSCKVDYLLIGGYAVGYHGYPRATADMDIWIDNHPENAARVVEALHRFGFNAPELAQELFLRPDKIIRMGYPTVRIEILTGVSGISFKECFQNKLTARMDGVDVNMIKLEDLKKNKAASRREKDLDDLKHLP